MVFDITHLKKIRKQLNLTQHQFAKESGISQSMVAKIESGKLDPTYSYVKRIESSIEKLTSKNDPGKTAKEIMYRGIISVNKNDKIKEIARLLGKHGISQVPVMDGKHIIGLVSESSLINNIDKNLSSLSVEDIMEDAPPIVAENTKLEAIRSLLRFSSIIVVQYRGELKGVITKADILKII